MNGANILHTFLCYHDINHISGLHTSRKSVLVAPLFWGLGHATRCIPIINKLISLGWKVHIASDGDALLLLKKEFPELTFHELPPYGVQYGDSDNLFTSLIFQVPGLMKNLSAEFLAVQKLQKAHGFDLIISDNRPGVKVKEVRSIYITHQINFEVKYGKGLGRRLHKMLYKDFNDVWIPDVQPPNNLAGKLSATAKGNYKYIGMLTRAEKENTYLKYDLLILLSGPEPQRSTLEQQLLRQLRGTSLKVALVRGTTVSSVQNLSKITVINMATSKEVDKLVAQSSVVLARCGYSTLMDLSVWRKKCILIPTPEQPEQEYLGKHLAENKWAHVVSQKELSLKEDLKMAIPFGFEGEVDLGFLEEV